MREQLKEEQRTLHSRFGEAKDQIEQTLAEFDDLKNRVTETATEITLGKYSKVFDSESVSLRSRARKWFWGTLSLTSITVILAIVLLVLTYEHGSAIYTEASSIVHIAIAKVVVFSVLYTAIYWCNKNYKATMHNAIINKHRANALSTFDIFAQSAHDNVTKDAVLIRATDAVFSLLSSGYTSRDADVGVNSPIMEIIKSPMKSE